MPHVYLYSAAALRGLSTDLEEAARVSGANPSARRAQRQPADDPAGDPVRRRAGVLPRLRAVRPAAGARRSAGPPGAVDLSLQADQQARHAVLSADGGRCGRASSPSPRRWCSCSASCCGRRSATSPCAARASGRSRCRWHVALGGVRRHRVLAARDGGGAAVRASRCARSW